MSERTAVTRRLGGSFRDPSGFVYERDGVLLRQVNRRFATDFDAFVSSGCYDRLVQEGLLVPHEEVAIDLAATSEAYRVVAPHTVPFVSYPYEWCPGQRRDAALLTLRVLEVALDHGLVLRDASAFNVQFERGRPVFIDTLSFGRYRPGEPWVAYRQFCQHFVAPLALESLVDARLGAFLQAHLDGAPLDLASRLLPLRTRLRPGLALHVHGQARASRTRPVDPQHRPRTAKLSEHALRGLVHGLRRLVRRLSWDPPDTTWSRYEQDADHYSRAAVRTKGAFVSAAVAAVRPATVWDLGANVGRYSRMAAEQGASVVAFDTDRGAVQRVWSEIGGAGLDILPLVMDVAAPTPAVGWAHEERLSLADRGPCDLLLALALIHHLAIAGNVPLGRIAALLARLGRNLVVEWVPKSDPKVQVLLATRRDVFTDYSQQGFLAAFDAHCDIVDQRRLPDSERVLYLLRRR